MMVRNVFLNVSSTFDAAYARKNVKRKNKTKEKVT